MKRERRSAPAYGAKTSMIPTQVPPPTPLTIAVYAPGGA